MTRAPDDPALSSQSPEVPATMFRRRALLACLALPAGLGACAGLPGAEATGTPVAPLVDTGFAALHADRAGEAGALLG